MSRRPRALRCQEDRHVFTKAPAVGTVQICFCEQRLLWGLDKGVCMVTPGNRPEDRDGPIRSRPADAASQEER